MTNLKKFGSETGKKDFKSKKYIYLALFGLLFLGVVEIWVNNTMANFGAKYENISKLQQNLKMENQVLENELAKQQSFINLATASAELGFSVAKDVQYLR